VIAFTILGLLVFYVWCFQAGYWLGFALDVLMPVWVSMKAFDAQMCAVMHQVLAVAADDAGGGRS
jgi:hypothetical protein